MSPFNNNVFYLFIFNKLVEIQSLVELRTAENNIIVTTEAITRKTVNELFSTLRLKGVKQKPRIKQFSTIHNFFVSLTLKDHDNFNKIVQLSRANHSDNSSVIEITLNELLSEDNSDDINDDSITEHVETFLNNLRYLKDKFRVDSLSKDTIINEEIMKVLIGNPGGHSNDTDLDIDDDNRILDDIETWFPEPDQEQKGRRIFQGHTTKAKHYPFMASIQFFNQFQCAGSIIKSDLIISAASCLQLAYNNRFFRENPAFLSVRVGSTFYEGGGENIPILEVYFHPSYDPKSLKHNLVLLRMIRRVNFKITKKKVKKIDIDRYASPLPENTDGITVVGWGAKESSNKVSNPWYNRLSYAVLDFYPLRECAEIYTKEFVTRTNFCAGFMSKGGGACNRDVGGPGIVDGGILAGVISFGSPVCGAPDAPTVFTKVGYYSDWIDEIMEQDVPRTARKTTLKPIPPEPTVPPSHLIHTTFKMDPLIGKIRPQPDELGGLRNQDESDLFTKFIEAMFGSKEVKESADMIDSLRQKLIDEPVEPLQEEKDKELTEVTTTDAPLMTGLAAPTTILDVYDISQEATEQTPKFTVLSENLLSSVEHNLEKDVVRLFDDIDLKKLIDEPKMDKLPISIEKKAFTDERKTTDDSILTLLYLTDTEKKNNKSSEESGLSISVESFKDLTFRNNITANELINLMSQSDLFKLLSATFQADTNENDSFDNTNTLDT